MARVKNSKWTSTQHAKMRLTVARSRTERCQKHLEAAIAEEAAAEADLTRVIEHEAKAKIATNLAEAKKALADAQAALEAQAALVASVEAEAALATEVTAESA